MPIKQIIKSMVTSKDEDLYTMSTNRLVFLVFLRHFGCIFCREALLDIASKRNNFDQKGILVFVHMADHDTAESYFEKFNLNNVSHISDPQCNYYQAFGLVKGRFDQLFGLKSFVRGIEVASKGIFPMIKEIGDARQMPGIFILKNGEIIERYIHVHASSKPNYDQLINCCMI